MPPRLQAIGANPTIRQFAQGAAQDNVQPVADFLAPGVDVTTSVGNYKEYDEENRFKLPETLRAIGGRAVELVFDATDAAYNCRPHAIDYPVDNLEQLETADLENMFMEGSQAVAEVAGLAHEVEVIDLALSTLGPGTNLTWDAAADPVDQLDGHILTITKAAQSGSLMGIGLLFGPTAFRIYKNHAKVRGQFVVGNTAKGMTATPGINDVGNLQLGQPESRMSTMVRDTAKQGKAKAISFLLDSSIFVFARKAQPTRRDASFMKTFRLRGQWMVPGSYMRDDRRVEVAKFDWSSDVKVTNSAAAVRLNIST